MDVGGGWVALGGSVFEVQSSRSQYMSGQESNFAATVLADAGAADFTLTVDCGSDLGQGVWVRAVSETSAWLCRNVLGTVQIYEVSGVGGFTLRASQGGA